MVEFIGSVAICCISHGESGHKLKCFVGRWREKCHTADFGSVS